jgi:hypothetical protein
MASGVWTKVKEFTTEKLHRVENAAKSAIAILTKLAEDVEEAVVAGHLSTKLAPVCDAGVSREIPKLLRNMRTAKVEGSWAKETLKQLQRIVPWWSKHHAELYKDYCRWCFTPRPKPNGLLGFKDCILEFKDKCIEQIKKVAAMDCYTYIPESLAYKPSDEFVEWFRKYFVTTIAGDMDAMELEFAVETLALFGKRLPHHQVVYFGTGGNSKGARTKLRARAFGTGHQFVSTSVFDKRKDDEFRKQGPEFYGAILCTIQEGDEFDVDEKVWRGWTAGDPLRVRLPHATHTPALDWETAGKFWELNPKKPPKFPSITETSNRRRIKGVEKDQSFTSERDKT